MVKRSRRPQKRTQESTSNSPDWQVAGASVCGVMHAREGTSNQDAWGKWEPKEEDVGYAVGAVADGHGSASCPRSQVGSRLAVRAGREVTRELLQSGRDNQEVRTAEELAETLAEALPEAVVRRWNALVADDLRKNGMRAREFDALEEAKGRESARYLSLNPKQAYGSTLLLAVAVEQFLVVAQLGDGACLFVEGEEGAESPIEKDERQIAHETFSLCTRDASEEVRTAVIETAVDSETLVVLCTDGVSDSFTEQEGLKQLGSDLRRDVMERGLSKVGLQFNEWLHSWSRDASADDATLCCLYAGPVESSKGDESEKSAALSGNEGTDVENGESRIEADDLWSGEDDGTSEGGPRVDGSRRPSVDASTGGTSGGSDGSLPRSIASPNRTMAADQDAGDSDIETIVRREFTVSGRLSARAGDVMGQVRNAFEQTRSLWVKPQDSDAVQDE